MGALSQQSQQSVKELEAAKKRASAQERRANELSYILNGCEEFVGFPAPKDIIKFFKLIEITDLSDELEESVCMLMFPSEVFNNISIRFCRTKLMKKPWTRLLLHCGNGLYLMFFVLWSTIDNQTKILHTDQKAKEKVPNLHGNVVKISKMTFIAQFINHATGYQMEHNHSFPRFFAIETFLCFRKGKKPPMGSERRDQEH